jgi:hypothetical protein
MTLPSLDSCTDPASAPRKPGRCAGIKMRAFFYVLVRAGWHLGAATGLGSPLHHAYLQATTMTFLSMVVAQIGTAFAGAALAQVRPGSQLRRR